MTIRRAGASRLRFVSFGVIIHRTDTFFNIILFMHGLHFKKNKIHPCRHRFKCLAVLNHNYKISAIAHRKVFCTTIPIRRGSNNIKEGQWWTQLYLLLFSLSFLVVSIDTSIFGLFYTKTLYGCLPSFRLTEFENKRLTLLIRLIIYANNFLRMPLVVQTGLWLS